MHAICGIAPPFSWPRRVVWDSGSSASVFAAIARTSFLRKKSVVFWMSWRRNLARAGQQRVMMNEWGRLNSIRLLVCTDDARPVGVHPSYLRTCRRASEIKRITRARSAPPLFSFGQGFTLGQGKKSFWGWRDFMLFLLTRVRLGGCAPPTVTRRCTRGCRRGTYNADGYTTMSRERTIRAANVREGC